MWAKTKFYNQIWADGGNEFLGKSIKKYIQCDDVAIGFWLLNQNRFGIGIYALLQGESSKEIETMFIFSSESEESGFWANWMRMCKVQNMSFIIAFIWA